MITRHFVLSLSMLIFYIIVLTKTHPWADAALFFLGFLLVSDVLMYIIFEYSALDKKDRGLMK